MLSVASKVFKSLQGARLKAYGLKYEDILSEACPAVQAAVSRLDGEVSLARTRRIKRAIDTSAKKKTMPSEATNYNPYEFYMNGKLAQAKYEVQEKAILEP